MELRFFPALWTGRIKRVGGDPLPLDSLGGEIVHSLLSCLKKNMNPDRSSA
jgi:hypothetical protein